MGTSSSSKGSPSNVPMVPPWVADVPSETPSDFTADLPSDEGTVSTPRPVDGLDLAGATDEGGANAPLALPINAKNRLAPTGRFSAARLDLRSFARSSDRQAMHRGMRYYVSRGYGGSSTATHRMGGTIQSSETLFFSGFRGSWKSTPSAGGTARSSNACWTVSR